MLVHISTARVRNLFSQADTSMLLSATNEYVIELFHDFLPLYKLICICTYIGVCDIITATATNTAIIHKKLP